LVIYNLIIYGDYKPAHHRRNKKDIDKKQNYDYYSHHHVFFIAARYLFETKPTSDKKIFEHFDYNLKKFKPEIIKIKHYEALYL
jgi:hypothetical protein